MKICLWCGQVFGDDEVAHWQEDRGECWGVRCYETVSGCPNCHGDYAEAVMCQKCGEYVPEDEIDQYGICDDCREKENEEFEEFDE